MDWTQAITIIISILVPVLAGLIGVITMIFKLKNEIGKIDNRLSRIEGYIEGRDINLKVKGK